MENRPVAVVVDENQPFLMYLSLLLNRMNLEVLPVNSAAEALEISRVTRPNLITMDMDLPDMDGLEALRAIREDNELANLSVIMISSYMDKHKQWEALSLGCVDVLDKPVDLRRLHKAVQGCDLYAGGRRRYLRAPFEQTIGLRYQGTCQQVLSVTLSERGIFLRTQDLFPKAAHVDIDLPLPSGETLRVGGSVIYARSADAGDATSASGIAVKFDRMTYKNGEILTALVEDLLIGDILSEQAEPVIKPKPS